MSPEKVLKKKDIKVVLKQLESDGLIGISVDCVIFGFDENELKVLLIKSDLKQYAGKWSLLGDLVHRDEDLDQAAYRILKDRTGMDDVYLEQVRSFGDVNRHPAARVDRRTAGTSPWRTGVRAGGKRAERCGCRTGWTSGKAIGAGRDGTSAARSAPRGGFGTDRRLVLQGGSPRDGRADRDADEPSRASSRGASGDAWRELRKR